MRIAPNSAVPENVPRALDKFLHIARFVSVGLKFTKYTNYAEPSLQVIDIAQRSFKTKELSIYDIVDRKLRAELQHILAISLSNTNASPDQIQAINTRRETIINLLTLNTALSN